MTESEMVGWIFGWGYWCYVGNVLLSMHYVRTGRGVEALAANSYP